MSERDDEPVEGPEPAARRAREPDLDWAGEIDRLRRARGERLRRIFATFDTTADGSSGEGQEER